MPVRLSSWAAALLLLALFAALSLVTVPLYIGDTIFYCQDVVRHAAGQPARFWEFGHLLWRPWGGLGLHVLGGVFASWFGDDPEQACARFLILTSWLAGAASLLLMRRLLALVAPPWIALAGAACLAVTNPFLHYSRSGAPYLPALLFLLLALVLLERAARQDSVSPAAIGAGASFALAVALWFPFCLTAPGALAYALWPPGGKRGASRGAAGFCAAAALACAGLYAMGALLHSLGGGGGLREWVSASRNEWQQSITAARLVTGLPRAVFDLGSDGVLLKRRLFHDPYSPVPATALVPVLAKLLLFYFALGLAGLALLRRWRKAWPLLAVAASGTLPLLFFAVFLFEPSSPERFLPAFPFVFLAAAGLAAMAPRGVAALAMLVMFAAAGAFNVAAADRFSLERKREAALARKDFLERQEAGRKAVAFVLNQQDALTILPATYPLDKRLRTPNLHTALVVEVATERAPAWKSWFACRVLWAWSQGWDVWVSDRVFAARPLPAWSWVEGDDRRVTWAELPRFLGSAETRRPASPATDGFVELPASPANRRWLEDQNRVNGSCAMY